MLRALCKTEQSVTPSCIGCAPTDCRLRYAAAAFDQHARFRRDRVPDVISRFPGGECFSMFIKIYDDGGGFDMNRIAFLVFPILLAAEAASADTTAGNKALALASLVAEHSPTLSPREKKVMARLFDGDLNFSFPADRTISVQADAVVCRASNVDITSRSCDLKFGTKRAALKARKAHELFATIAEVGVPEDGAAGSIFESLSRLTCTISPHEIQQKAGGGADCRFDKGGPPP